MLVFGSNSASTGYNLTRSLRFRASASAYLGRTPASATNKKVWTYSAWIKRGVLGVRQVFFEAYASGAEYSFFEFTSSDTLRILNTITGPTQAEKITTQVFRDPSAWYHIVVASNSSTSLNLYVNGVQVTSFSTSTGPNATDWAFNQSLPHVIAADRTSGSTTNPFDGYHAELNWIDGQALTPSSFGSTNALTGVWQPAAYTGTYGTNGFYLPFTDNSALTTASNVGLGKDFSGNANYFVTNNISITAGVTYDSMTDVPTLTSATAANFAVLNPLGNAISTAVSSQISNANLKYSGSSAGGCAATMALPAGKYYFETTISAIYGLFVGLGTDARNLQSDYGLVITNIYGWYINPTISLVNNGTSTTWTSNTVSTGTVVNLAIDASNLSSVKVWLGKANVYYDSSAGTTGNPSTGANPTLTITAGINLYPNLGFFGGGTSTIEANFGQRPFTYTAPTGFVALNTYNLPTSTIVKGNTVMDATTYTGAGGTQSITNTAGFKPDFVWAKSRSNAFDHVLYDSVRGAGTAKYLISNATSAEGNYSNSYGSLSSFNSNGFTVATGTDPTNPNAFFNQSAATYVAWQWQAGQGSTSSNTSGSITSTVSVNASAGFSVVTYTGTGVAATVGHGLGVAPSLIIVKNRTNAFSWSVYSASLGNTQYLFLNSSNAAASDVGQWNNTTPTSSVFSIGTSNNTGVSATNYVAYCWTPIAGFSAFGSYTGNGSADGPFVYTGFRPKFVMMKRTDNVGDWWMYDTSRSTFNTAVLILYANTSAAEISDSNVDMLSNGFKFRTASTQPNTSGGTFIYMAFAENPLKYALAR